MQIARILTCVACSFPLLLTSQSISGDVAEAQSAFTSGQYSRAAELYKKAVATHSPSAELQTDLGLAYQMQGEHLRAIGSYLAALRVEELPRTRELLAIERCRLRQFHTVSPLLAKIAENLSYSDALLPVLSPCFLQADNAVDAIRVAKTLIVSRTMPQDAALIYQGQASMNASNFFISELGKTPEGPVYIQYLKAARDAGSEDARGGFSLAIAHSSYLHPDLTHEEGIALLPVHSGDPALLYMLSVLSGEQAMESILECERKYPESPGLEQFQAEMLANQGQTQQAEGIYLRLLKSHPELPELRHSIGMLYRGQGEWSQALPLFQAELAANPTDDRAVTGISECLIQLGDYSQAIKFLAPLFVKTTPPLWAVLDLSLAYQKLGRYLEAIDVLRRGEKTFPRESQIHFRLMRLYTLTSQMDFAQKESALFQEGKHP
jgi:tetratricopeptide (TPR) repeat protein